MYHRAVGYSYHAVKIFQHDGNPVVVPYIRHVPPDVKAAIFWLTNRRPDEWKSTNSHEVKRGTANDQEGVGRIVQRFTKLQAERAEQIEQLQQLEGSIEGRRVEDSPRKPCAQSLYLEHRLRKRRERPLAPRRMSASERSLSPHGVGSLRQA